MAGDVVFKLGSFGNFNVSKKGRLATDPPSPGLRRDMGAKMAMIVLSSPATLTGAEEKKTGPSRFNEDFFDRIHIAGIVATLTESESGVVSERTLNHILVLTGTAPRGGQGVGLLSLM
jgi:hypothetical protein